MGVREGLLALLDREPAYGYQLKTGFESATGGIWSINVGQVYATLDRLDARRVRHLRRARRPAVVPHHRGRDRRSWARGGKRCPATSRHRATSSP